MSLNIMDQDIRNMLCRYRDRDIGLQQLRAWLDSQGARVEAQIPRVMRKLDESPATKPGRARDAACAATRSGGKEGRRNVWVPGGDRVKCRSTCRIDAARRPV